MAKTRAPWDDELKGRKGSAQRDTAPLSAEKVRRLKAIVDNTTEVVFTVSRSKETTKERTNAAGKTIASKTSYPSPRSASALQGLAEYISRDESETLCDDQGLSYTGAGAVAEALEGWDLPEIPSHRREAIHIVMSMPDIAPDGTRTDVASVQRASEQTAAWLFRNHRYILAHHIDSESGHPHTHVIVKCEPKNLTDGTRRLDPSRRQLRRYRETFADKLNAVDVAASATSRKARLSGREYVPQAKYKHLEKQDKLTGTDKLSEAKQGTRHKGIDEQADAYMQDARVLAATGSAEDAALSVKLSKYVARMLGNEPPEGPVQVQSQASAEAQQSQALDDARAYRAAQQTPKLNQ